MKTCMQMFGDAFFSFYRRFPAVFFLIHSALQYYSRPIRRHKKELRNFILTLSANKNINILDFGCGEGIFTDVIKQVKGATLIGIDNDLSCLRYARKRRSLGHYLVGDERLCFKDKCFDAVMINTVLHHMKADGRERLAAELRRVVKPSGYLLVIELVPRHKQKGMIFRALIYAEEYVKKIEYCDENSLADLLRGGFKQVRFDKIRGNFEGFAFKHIPE